MKADVPVKAGGRRRSLLEILLGSVWFRRGARRSATPLPLPLKERTCQKVAAKVPVTDATDAVRALPRDTAGKRQAALGFVPPGRSIRVAGYDAQGPLYLGNTLIGEFVHLPGVINPLLTVADSAEHCTSEENPHFTLMSAEQRCGYLIWLSGTGKRETPWAYMSLELFTYEWFFLRDLPAKRLKEHSKDMELSLLKFVRSAEVLGYWDLVDEGNKLLDYTHLVYHSTDIDRRAGSLPYPGSLATRYFIALHAKLSPEVPLPAAWALQWLYGYAGVTRTPWVKNNYRLMRSVFAQVYAKEPIIPMPNTTKLAFSAGFHHLKENITWPVLGTSNMSDPTMNPLHLESLKALHGKVRPIVQQIVRALDKGDLLKLAASLPAEVHCNSIEPLRKIRAELLDELQPGQVVTMPLVTALEKFNASLERAVVIGIARQCATAMATLGIVMVPSPALMPVTLTAESTVKLYRGEPLVALSDRALGQVVLCRMCINTYRYSPEFESQCELLRAWNNGLECQSERFYITNLFDWMLASPSTHTGLKKLAEKLPDSVRDGVLAGVVQLAIQARLTKSLLLSVERDYLSLGGTKQGLANAINAAAGKMTAEIGLPPEAAQKPTGRLALDHERVMELQIETENTARMLDTIFESSQKPEEGADSCQNSERPVEEWQQLFHDLNEPVSMQKATIISRGLIEEDASDENGVDLYSDHIDEQITSFKVADGFRESENDSPAALAVNVDNVHSVSWHTGRLDRDVADFADWLIAEEEWPIAEVRAQASKCGVMMDGAIEAINEVAFELFGEGLVEVGDIVTVYIDLTEDR